MILLPIRRALALRVAEDSPLPPEEENEDGGELREPEVRRPRTRGECVDGMRPCPFVSCKYHLYLEVRQSYSGQRIKFNFPGIEVDEMAESCALDIADRGVQTLETIGLSLNLVRERVRQLEADALAKITWLLERNKIDFEESPDLSDKEPYLRRVRPSLKGACAG